MQKKSEPLEVPTMTFPFREGLPENIRKPYSDYDGESNTKPRRVYCKICKYIVTTNLPGPRCGGCKSYLIVVPRHTELMK